MGGLNYEVPLYVVCQCHLPVLLHELIKNVGITRGHYMVHAEKVHDIFCRASLTLHCQVCIAFRQHCRHPLLWHWIILQHQSFITEMKSKMVYLTLLICFIISYHPHEMTPIRWATFSWYKLCVLLYKLKRCYIMNILSLPLVFYYIEKVNVFNFPKCIVKLR